MRQAKLLILLALGLFTLQVDAQTGAPAHYDFGRTPNVINIGYEP